MSGLRRPRIVIRRSPGTFVRGVYTGAVEQPPSVVDASIQPANRNDVQRLQTTSPGRRYSAVLRMFTIDNLELASDQHPGDIVVEYGERWLVTGRSIHDVTGGPVSHNKYLLTKEIENVPAEVLP